MDFTTINVTKQNYAFSDFMFSDDTQDYPHHWQMAEYIYNYSKKFNLFDNIKFNTKIEIIKPINKNNFDDGWIINCKNIKTNNNIIYNCKNIVLATGHHSVPKYPKFKGLNENFKGKIMHAVEFKSSNFNNIKNKKVLVVGIGNSAVDCACNLFEQGSCDVTLSTRSSAWVIPNYIFGYPTDLYANRSFLYKPWQLGQIIMEITISLISGHPNKWGLKPKKGPLQTQPTVSPLLIHHLQRRNIKLINNIKEVLNDGSVKFDNDKVDQFDIIILCTGYLTSLDMFEDDIKNQIIDEKTNKVNLYKSAFSPYIGKSILFNGFVQPASGGIISMSEIQARWFSEIIKNNFNLPNKNFMINDIKKEQKYIDNRWNKQSDGTISTRHSIQRDPIVYNDMISNFIGCNPFQLKVILKYLFSHPLLFFRLWVGSNGVSQYRLTGPNSKPEFALEQIYKTPIPFVSKLLFFGDILMLYLCIKIIKKFLLK